jgi:Na+-transporting NADH:ubiquinone oxidoreductase subunit NqrB
MSFASSVIAPRWTLVAGTAFADARHFQIATLATLAAIHITSFDLGATPAQAAVTIVATVAMQWVCARLTATAFDWRSPLITALSLTLLLRTHSPELWVAAPVLAIGSKYLLRWRGKHLFNPATFAIVILLIVSPDVWVSPGQWGSAVWLALLLAGCAGLVRPSRVALLFAR